jgi:hypothetical protein
MWVFFFHSSDGVPESMRVVKPAMRVCPLLRTQRCHSEQNFPIFYNNKKLNIFYSKHFNIMSRLWVLFLTIYHLVLNYFLYVIISINQRLLYAVILLLIFRETQIVVYLHGPAKNFWNFRCALSTAKLGDPWSMLSPPKRKHIYTSCLNNNLLCRQCNTSPLFCNAVPRTVFWPLLFSFPLPIEGKETSVRRGIATFVI